MSCWVRVLVFFVVFLIFVSIKDTVVIYLIWIANCICNAAVQLTVGIIHLAKRLCYRQVFVNSSFELL